MVVKWPSIDEDIKAHCVVCQASRNFPPMIPLYLWSFPERLGVELSERQLWKRHVDQLLKNCSQHLDSGDMENEDKKIIDIDLTEVHVHAPCVLITFTSIRKNYEFKVHLGIGYD